MVNSVVRISFWLKFMNEDGVVLPDAFCKNTGHFILSTAPNLSSVVIRKRHRENRETMSIVIPQL